MRHTTVHSYILTVVSVELYRYTLIRNSNTRPRRLSRPTQAGTCTRLCETDREIGTHGSTGPGRRGGYGRAPTRLRRAGATGAGPSIVDSVSRKKEPFKNIELHRHTVHLTVTFSARHRLWPGSMPGGQWRGLQRPARVKNGGERAARPPTTTVRVVPARNEQRCWPPCPPWPSRDRLPGRQQGRGGRSRSPLSAAPPLAWLVSLYGWPRLPHAGCGRGSRHRRAHPAHLRRATAIVGRRARRAAAPKTGHAPLGMEGAARLGCPRGVVF